MAGWLVGERRGISWQDQTLESISAPQLGLVAFLAVVAMFMYLTTLNQVTERVERKRTGFMFRLLLLPIAVSLVIIVNMLRRRMMQQMEVISGEPMRQAAAAEDWSSAWGVVLVLLMVLLMVYYQPSSQSVWLS